MSRTDEREEAYAEVMARLKNRKLDPCLDCGGQGYTDMGKSACFWCRGAGVITQQMAHAFGVADRAEKAAQNAPQESCDCAIGDCVQITRKCREDADGQPR